MLRPVVLHRPNIRFIGRCVARERFGRLSPAALSGICGIRGLQQLDRELALHHCLFRFEHELGRRIDGARVGEAALRLAAVREAVYGMRVHGERAVVDDRARAARHREKADAVAAVAAVARDRHDPAHRIRDFGSGALALREDGNARGPFGRSVTGIDHDCPGSIISEHGMRCPSAFVVGHRHDARRSVCGSAAKN